MVLGHNNHNGRLVAIKSMPKASWAGRTHAQRCQNAVVPTSVLTITTSCMQVRGKLSRSTTLGKISREVCVMQKAQSASPSVVQLLDCFEVCVQLGCSRLLWRLSGHQH